MKEYHKGKFTGKYDTSTKVNLLHILKWKLFGHQMGLRKNTLKPLELHYQNHKLSQEKDFICWLSHASFFIQFGGKRFLLDPVFGNVPFYKRKIQFPYTIKEMSHIDYLLISHVHYDHFDTKSIHTIAKISSPKAILPLHMGKVLHKNAIDIKIKELDWYECYDDGEVKITLVPAKHWGRRGIFDKNRALWGGYVLTYKDKSIYFSGDTAAGDHFTEIGKRFNIEYALLPIGAYKPEFIMKHNHLNPKEAFEAYRQLNAKTMIPMHYGTFKLTDEPLDEALTWIEKIDKENPNTINILKVGEVLDI